MAYFRLSKGVDLYYEKKGKGQPVIFIHGVWMSSRFFKKQMPYFAKRYQAIALDLRGHGRSSHVPKTYRCQLCADLRAFIRGLKLKNVILAGWSMGSFVIWDYFRQFGAENVRPRS